MRIGLLEDDAELCAMLKEMLEAGGHSVSAYLDGSEILATFHLDEPKAFPPPFDILLVDLILSGEIDGEQVIHQVRMRYSDLPIMLVDLILSGDIDGEQVIHQVRMRHSDLPIVVISAVTSSHLEAVIRRYPGVKALRKPFKLRNLFAAIEGEQSFL